MVTQGILVKLEARAGRDAEVEMFLQSLRSLAQIESDTKAWFALRSGRSEYGIFAAFPGVTARDDHLRGPAVAAIQSRADALFVRQPRIQRLAIFADKLPFHPTAESVAKAMLLTFRAKAGRASDVEQFLRSLKFMVQEELRTVAWFAIYLESGDYGIFDAFPDNSARFSHLTGQVPRALAKHSLSLLGSMPDLEMLNVLGDKMPCQLRLTP